MKEELYITFHSEDDIRHFVDTCNEFDDAIDIRIQKMAMDAKSLLGMLLMKTEEPLEIEYACYDDEDNYEEFKERVKEGGFFLCHWDGTAETEAKIKEDTQATIRCVPFEFEQTPGVDMVSGKPAKCRVLIARSY